MRLDPSSRHNQYPYNPGDEVLNQPQRSQTPVLRSGKPKNDNDTQLAPEQPAASTQRRRREASSSSSSTRADADADGEETAEMHAFVGHLLTESHENSSTYRRLAGNAARAATQHAQYAPRSADNSEHMLHADRVEESADVPIAENQLHARALRVATDSTIREALERGRTALEHLKSNSKSSGQASSKAQPTAESLYRAAETGSNMDGTKDEQQLLESGGGADSKKRYRREIGYLARYADADHEALRRVLELVAQKDRVTAENCKNMPPDALVLPGAVAYDVERQFDNQVQCER